MIDTFSNGYYIWSTRRLLQPTLHSTRVGSDLTYTYALCAVPELNVLNRVSDVRGVRIVRIIW